MDKEAKNSYAISLDMGTNSIGWAVIDTKTKKLVRKNGKEVWV